MKKDSNVWWIAGIAVIILVGWWIIGNAPQGQNNMSDTTATTTSQQSAAQGGSKGISSTIRATSNVVMIAENLENASVFGSWLRSTGVGAKLTGAGPYTIFVPSDTAIAQLPKGTYTNLSTAEKLRFVEYHVVVGKAMSTKAIMSGSTMAMSRDMLNFNYGTNNIPMVNSAKVIAEYKGSNGVVYLINTALIPPQKLQ